MASKIHNMKIGKFIHQKKLYKSTKKDTIFFKKYKGIDERELKLLNELENIGNTFLLRLNW